MSRSRPVPGIARGPQQFSQRIPQPIASPMTPPPIPITAPIAPISEDSEDDLAQEIYCRLAMQVIGDARPDLADHNSSENFREHLAAAAKIAKLTAKVYFEEGSNRG